MANPAGEQSGKILDLQLLDACRDKNIAAVRELLKEGADPKNLEKKSGNPEEFSVSPLHYAAYNGW